MYMYINDIAKEVVAKEVVIDRLQLLIWLSLKGVITQHTLVRLTTYIRHMTYDVHITYGERTTYV